MRLAQGDRWISRGKIEWTKDASGFSQEEERKISENKNFSMGKQKLSVSENTFFVVSTVRWD